MNLLEIRTQCTQDSGRYDLADPTTFADNGMDFHINAGQKYLDKLVPVPENFAQLFLPLAIDEYSITFQNHCRNITDVFINTSSARWPLVRVTLNELKEYYSGLVSTIDSGGPGYYALANLRALETTVKTSLGTFINLTWEEADEKYDYRGIIIVPPTDESAVVEVSGKFSQNILTADLDTNYWATEYPHLLVMATLRSIEVFNRNTEGAKDWSRSIQTEVINLDFDVVEEESYNATQMEG